MYQCVIAYFISAITIINAARVLGVYPLPSYSDYQLGSRIFKELARRGHDVTVISAIEEKEAIKNFTQVLINGASKRTAEMRSTLYHFSKQNIIEKIIWMDTLGIDFTELALNCSNVQKFLKEKNHFDVVILQNFMSDAINGFCYYFQAPCIIVSGTGAVHWFSDKVGLSAPPSFVPELLLSYSSTMNFWERFHNSLVYVLVELSYYIYRYPNQNRLLQKYFPGAPPLRNLYYNLSLILVNGHVSVSDVSPTLPNIIDIAGYHVYPPSKLPEDLQQYLDSSSDGVIYFSMGSHLQSKDLPTDYISAFLNVFSKLNQTVLWKWEDKVLPGKPDNVIIRPWFPQQDILAHPNVVLFITHGGFLSTIEAVYHGKPILAIPVFGDQGMNAVKVQNDGYGRYVTFDELNEHKLRQELNEVLTNLEYTTNAKMRSKIMHDQPISPINKAMFWIDYVTRYKGAPHLKSSVMLLTWYQYFLLDIILVLLMSFVLMAFIIHSIFLNIFRSRMFRYKLKQN